jgi:hypothetical protein
MKRLRTLLVTMIAAAGLVAFVVLMGSLIYPGAMKWTAGSVCPEDKPDTVVVRDTYQTEPGETSTNFTLYCIGPRGETEDVGFAKPVGVLILWAAGLAGIVILALFAFGTLRRLLTGGGGGGGGADSDDGANDMASESVGTVAPPMADYGGQPPLIT